MHKPQVKVLQMTRFLPIEKICFIIAMFVIIAFANTSNASEEAYRSQSAVSKENDSNSHLHATSHRGVYKYYRNPYRYRYTYRPRNRYRYYPRFYGHPYKHPFYEERYYDMSRYGHGYRYGHRYYPHH